MTQTELFQALKSLGLPVAYGHFEGTPQNPVPALPYIVYQFSNSDDLKADNQNYFETSNFQVELYSAKKDLAKEKLLQDKLKELSLPYNKIETWIESESFYQIIYEIQLLGG